MMSVLRRIAMGMGGTVVVALVIGLAAPKTVRAVVSTLVTVANTSANPVPTQAMDNPALQHFEVSASCTTVVSCANDTVILNVPVGMTAVVQDVSADCQVAVPDVLNSLFARLGRYESALGRRGNCRAHTNSVDAECLRREQIRIRATSNTVCRQHIDGPAGTVYVQDIGASHFVFCTANISGYYVKNGL